MNEQLQKYRSWLIETERKAQEDFDKTVISLSGGALGISFAFVKDIVGNKPLTNSRFLMGSWIAWGVSVTCVLASFYFSQQALRRAIKQVDQDEIYEQTPGGFLSKLTTVLNALSALLFLVGLVFIVIFVSNNLR